MNVMKRNARHILKFVLPMLTLGLWGHGPPAARAADAFPVRVATSNSSSDAPIFIAQKKGYFAQEGFAVSTVAFDSAAKMMAPMGSGELDVGSGSATAGLYNAV